jgi:diguanylate cyclase (GGDEF)-like protein/PAS domain S-box-containing protein
VTTFDESAAQKKDRLSELKLRAEAVLANAISDPSVALSGDALNAAKLLEDLRIYQVELELQNEELRAAQLAAETARKRYEYLFSQMPIAAMVLDTHGMLDDSNELANQLLGPRRTFVAFDRRLESKFSLKDRSRLHAALRDVVPGEVQVLQQVDLVVDDARTTKFDVHLIGLSIDYKLDRRILLLLVDRGAEAARREDQQFFSQLLNSSDAFIHAFDQHGKAILVNQSMLDFLGVKLDEVRGHSHRTLWPLRDAIAHIEADKKVLLTGQTLSFEEQVHRVSDGGVLDLMTRKFPLRDTAGKVYGVAGISTDITALKDQHRLALLSETVFRSSSDAIVITDADKRILRVNPAFSLQTGFSADTVMGKKASILRSGIQDKASYRKMWESIDAFGKWAGEINNRRADGTQYTVWSNINTVVDDDGTVLHYIAVLTDVTRLLETQLALARQASYDSLTGLPNRTLLNDRIAQLTALSLRHSNSFGLLFVDLDRFKEVNDSLGHQAGDTLLREVSKRLQSAVRLEDTVARIGGDEFVVLLPNIEGVGARAVADKLLGYLREPVWLEEGVHYTPMASVGVAIYPQDGSTPDLLLRSADMAMYHAKMEGRNRVAEYVGTMGDASEKAFAIQTELAEAVAQKQLQIFFQPMCRLSDGALMGAEVLVRWQRPGVGLMLPGDFLEVAEKFGQLLQVDRWVLNEALRQLGAWGAAGLWQAHWRLAVNRHAMDLQQADMVDELKRMLQTHGVSASTLELEVTEDALLKHTPDQIARLAELRALGASVSIDDFGTGYSSLAYLRRLPVSVIKIDKSFISDMLTDENDAVLVRAIVDLAHNLGHTLVAEGIETPDQLAHLARLGVELGQGFLFDAALSAEEFAQNWLRKAATA